MRLPSLPFELFVGLRYLRAKRRNRFLSLITVISALGIGVGVAALITVLSVMNGFHHELRSRILGVTSHMVVMDPFEEGGDWRGLIDKAKQRPEVAAGAPYIRQQAMLTRGSNVSGVMVRGILPEHEPAVSEVVDNLKSGKLADLRPGEYGIVLGKDLARSMALDVGDSVTLVAPSGQVTPAGMWPRFKRFQVVGVFDAGMYQYDSGMVYLHLADVQRLFRMGDALSGVRLRLHDPMQAPKLRPDLERLLDGQYLVRDWSQRHRNFFKALQTEKAAMFVILSLIVLVAAFNIVSSLVMLVSEKRGDIAILRTLGASPGHITRIFMVQGTLIGAAGVAAGTLGGVALALNVEGIVQQLEQWLGMQFISGQVYAISELPSRLRTLDVAWIAGAALAMSFLATIYPARSAAKTDPVEALRHE